MPLRMNELFCSVLLVNVSFLEAHSYGAIPSVAGRRRRLRVTLGRFNGRATCLHQSHRPAAAAPEMKSK